MNKLPYHKTSINIPNELYDEMKRESKVLGINFNALLLIKLNYYKQQQDNLKLLEKAIETINEYKNK